MNSNALDLVVATVLSAVFGLLIMWQQLRLAGKLKTNHGKTAGQHIEETALEAKQANMNAQLVQLQLQQYKQEQAAISQREHDLIQAYVDDDRAAHAELRSMITQVALEKKPPE